MKVYLMLVIHSSWSACKEQIVADQGLNLVELNTMQKPQKTCQQCTRTGRITTKTKPGRYHVYRPNWWWRSRRCRSKQHYGRANRGLTRDPHLGVMGENPTPAPLASLIFNAPAYLSFCIFKINHAVLLCTLLYGPRCYLPPEILKPNLERLDLTIDRHVRFKGRYYGHIFVSSLLINAGC